MSDRSVEEIRADLAANRAKFAEAVSEGVEAVKPKNIARESVNQVKQFAKSEFDTLTAQVRDDEGGWRKDRLMMIGGAILGLVVFAVTVSAISKARAPLDPPKRRPAIGRD